MSLLYPAYEHAIISAKNHLAHLITFDNTRNHSLEYFDVRNYNKILIFINGGGNHSINSKNHKIENNSIHLLVAQDSHWIEPSISSSGFMVAYKDQFLYKLQFINPSFDYHNIFSHSSILNLNLINAQEFEFIFKEILRPNLQSAYLLQVIGTLITKIASLNQLETQEKKAYDPLIEEVIKLIDFYYTTQKTIDFYAQELNLTPRTLQNRLKKVSSTTIGKLLQQRILKEAKKLLCTTNRSIGTIAFDLGFNETAHFTNWFKKYTKQLPLTYRTE